MPSPRVVAAVPLLLLAGLGACGTSGSAKAGSGPVALEGAGDGEDQASAVGDHSSSMLTATLAGAAEVAAGDPDASGRATVVVEPGRSQLCYRIEVRGITGVDGTALHHGADGEQGPVVLGLDSPEGGSVEGCVTADSDLLDRVGRTPEAFYLNVRSDEHPDGAVRGQLTPQRPS